MGNEYKTEIKVWRVRGGHKGDQWSSLAGLRGEGVEGRWEMTSPAFIMCVRSQQ